MTPVYCRTECPFQYCDQESPFTACLKQCHHVTAVFSIEIRECTGRYQTGLGNPKSGFSVTINGKEVCSFPYRDQADELVNGLNAVLPLPAADTWVRCDSGEIPQIGQLVDVVIDGFLQNYPAYLDRDDHSKFWRWLDESADSAPFESVTHWRARTFNLLPPSPSRTPGGK